jgi:hypothetical protein
MTNNGPCTQTGPPRSGTCERLREVCEQAVVPDSVNACTPIYVEDVEAREQQAGVKASAGDALFVRTGVWARRKELGA